MNLKQKLAALKAEAAELRKKGADDLTEEDVTRIPLLKAEIDDTESKIKAQEAAAEALKSAVTAEDEQPAGDAPAARTKARGEAPLSVGESFVQSEALKAFRTANPNGVAKGSPIQIEARGIATKKASQRAVKAPLNTTDNGDTAPTRLPGIEDVTYRKPNTLLDLITVGTTAAPWLEYRQLVSVTNNASIVPESRTNNGVGIAGGVKPISDLQTRKADAKAHTYADGIEATTQELNDDGALTSLIDGVLTQNLRDEIERIVLIGDEDDDEPAGIMNTTGVLQQAFATDMVTSVRKAKTLLWETSSTAPQAIVLNPEDDEEFDLLKDANERYYGNGPFGTGPQTIWAVPRVVSSAMPKGQALMGQFNAFQLLIFEALSILAFNQHKDYAQRNLVYVRAELRALQLFRQPARLAVVDLTAGA